MDPSIGSMCPVRIPPWRAVFAAASMFAATSGCANPAAFRDPAEIAISNTALFLSVGESVTLTARAGVSESQPAWSWSSSDPALLRSDGGGRVTALRPGRATIVVRAGNRMDSATVRIGEPEYGSLAWASVHAGARFTCALDTSGERYCWGENPFGSHGNGTRRLYTFVQSPIAAADPRRYVALSAGTFHACGITVEEAGYCWGNNSGRSSDYELTPQRLDLPATLAEIRSGAEHACALDTDNTRYCWGSNLKGALGALTSGPRQVKPLRIVERERFVTLSTGFAHTCGISLTGESFCWGTALAGELGEGSASAVRPLPHAVSTGVTFTQISAGNSTTCALTADGRAYCWGLITKNDGVPRRDETAVPVPQAPELRFEQLEAGSGHICGRTGEGMVYCWGMNEWGQTGEEPDRSDACASPYADGPVTCTAAPRLVSPALRFRQISVGRQHSCGVTTTGAIHCWGRNDAGQLGTGRLAGYAAHPTRVAPAGR